MTMTPHVQRGLLVLCVSVPRHSGRVTLLSQPHQDGLDAPCLSKQTFGSLGATQEAPDSPKPSECQPRCAASAPSVELAASAAQRLPRTHHAPVVLLPDRARSCQVVVEQAVGRAVRQEIGSRASPGALRMERGTTPSRHPGTPGLLYLNKTVLRSVY